MLLSEHGCVYLILFVITLFASNDPNFTNSLRVIRENSMQKNRRVQLPIKSILHEEDFIGVKVLQTL